MSLRYAFRTTSFGRTLLRHFFVVLLYNAVNVALHEVKVLPTILQLSDRFVFRLLIATAFT